MSDPRKHREPRGPGEPRDPRDTRAPGDPRDPRDPARSIAETDIEFRKAISGYHKLRWSALGALIALIVIAMALGAIVITHQQDQIRALRKQLAAGCSFFSDLAEAPLVATPPATQPSQLGVTIIVDARMTAQGLGCANLGAPSASLKKWATYYHIPLR